MAGADNASLLLNDATVFIYGIQSLKNMANGDSEHITITL
ncbi:conserved hypothetical protein [delta proteobacterium NaphS2]|nr:conserved hypothetical protein [delta proteobacterium NaphS2]